ncbi:MAG: nuclear transport factor 2 family protein [Pseudomonadota bacterium]
MSMPTLSDVETEAIKAMIEAWTSALVARDWPAWQGHWAEDGVLMPPGHARIAGRAALVAFATSDLGAVTGFTFSDWTFDGQDDFAVVTNTIRVDVAGSAPDQPAPSNDQMLLVRKHTDGNWRVHKVIFNASGPA